MNDVGEAVSAKVVQLKETAAYTQRMHRPTQRVAGPCGKVLLFTGVRYERDGGRPRDVPARGARPDRGRAPSRG
jgi:hypothetical protein